MFSMLSTLRKPLVAEAVIFILLIFLFFSGYHLELPFLSGRFSLWQELHHITAYLLISITAISVYSSPKAGLTDYVILVAGFLILAIGFAAPESFTSYKLFSHVIFAFILLSAFCLNIYHKISGTSDSRL